MFPFKLNTLSIFFLTLSSLSLMFGSLNLDKTQIFADEHHVEGKQGNKANFNPAPVYSPNIPPSIYNTDYDNNNDYDHHRLNINNYSYPSDLANPSPNRYNYQQDPYYYYQQPFHPYYYQQPAQRYYYQQTTIPAYLRQQTQVYFEQNTQPTNYLIEEVPQPNPDGIYYQAHDNNGNYYYFDENGHPVNR